MPFSPPSYIENLYHGFRFFLTGLAALLVHSGIYAQDCPPNIDFERGNFDGWVCYTGSVSAINGTNRISLAPSGPIAGQHTLYGPADAGLRDEFGRFPVLCPNGSGYSVKLGNTTGGAQAEGISYSFTIPAGRNTYSLVYNYAVVFQDPNHLEFQQPRLVLEVWNETDQVMINCSSFTFYPVGSPLPGFFNAGVTDSTDVWCKDWSAVSINLNGMAGKEIRLFFKTADCTFRRHFGYAYVDVNTECSSEFTGATYCPDDTAVVVTGPFGYQSYRWFDAGFTQLLGTTQILNLSPPPPSGTLIAVEVNPYNGYGCRDTLYARLIDTLTLTAYAGPDITSCNLEPVQIGGPRKPGVNYNWDPPDHLSDATVSNPRANPPVTTPYVLTVRSLGGGCLNRDTALVTSSVIDSSLQLIGKQMFCVTSGDSAVLQVSPTDSVQWFLNNSAIAGANQPRYRATQSGSYFARLYTRFGCTRSTRVESVIIETPRRGTRYPVQYAVQFFPVPLQARDFGVDYLWKPALYLDQPAIPDPVFNSPVLGDREYTVDITTLAGCLTVDTQMVNTIKEVRVFVPTAFTPNNDGRNDFLRPIMLGMKELKYFRIYNRWGQLVYDMRTNERGWDGTLKGLPQSTSVYVWMVEILGLDNRRYFQKGTVTLIR